MFKRLGLAGEQKPQPVRAIMFKRLVQESSGEGAPVIALVFKRRVPESRQKKHRSRPSCSNIPPLPSCSNGSPEHQGTARRSVSPRVQTARPCRSLPPTMPVDSWGRSSPPSDGGARVHPPNGLGSPLTQLNNDHSEPTLSPIRR